MQGHASSRPRSCTGSTCAVCKCDYNIIIIVTTYYRKLIMQRQYRRVLLRRPRVDNLIGSMYVTFPNIRHTYYIIIIIPCGTINRDIVCTYRAIFVWSRDRSLYASSVDSHFFWHFFFKLEFFERHDKYTKIWSHTLAVSVLQVFDIANFTLGRTQQVYLSLV